MWLTKKGDRKKERKKKRGRERTGERGRGGDGGCWDAMNTTRREEEGAGGTGRKKKTHWHEAIRESVRDGEVSRAVCLARASGCGTAFDTLIRELERAANRPETGSLERKMLLAAIIRSYDAAAMTPLARPVSRAAGLRTVRAIASYHDCMGDRQNQARARRAGETPASAAIKHYWRDATGSEIGFAANEGYVSGSTKAPAISPDAILSHASVRSLLSALRDTGSGRELALIGTAAIEGNAGVHRAHGRLSGGARSVDLVERAMYRNAQRRILATAAHATSTCADVTELFGAVARAQAQCPAEDDALSPSAVFRDDGRIVSSALGAIRTAADVRDEMGPGSGGAGKLGRILGASIGVGAGLGDRTKAAFARAWHRIYEHEERGRGDELGSRIFSIRELTTCEATSTTSINSPPEMEYALYNSLVSHRPRSVASLAVFSAFSNVYVNRIAGMMETSHCLLLLREAVQRALKK